MVFPLIRPLTAWPQKGATEGPTFAETSRSQRSHPCAVRMVCCARWRRPYQEGRDLAGQPLGTHSHLSIWHAAFTCSCQPQPDGSQTGEFPI
jgi:hypothetical protein